MATFDDSKTRGRSNPSENIKEDVKSTASDATDTAKQKATQALDQNRETAADEVEGLASAARAAASNLSEQDKEGLSQYVTELADNVGSLASGLRNKNVDQLIHDAKDIAHKNPALFIGGSIAIGLGLSRFAKASSHHSESRASESRQSSDSQYADFSSQTTEPASGSSYTTASATEQPPAGAAGLSARDRNSSNTLGGSRYE